MTQDKKRNPTPFEVERWIKVEKFFVDMERKDIMIRLRRIKRFQKLLKVVRKDLADSRSKMTE